MAYSTETASLLLLALEVAGQAHKGQTYGDLDYFGYHVLNVTDRVSKAAIGLPDYDDYRMTAILHDSVEDSELTIEQLAQLGFPESVVEAVDALTKREGEEYLSYLMRVKSNDMAWLVKREDVKENLSNSLDQSKRREKYTAALRMLGDS